MLFLIIIYFLIIHSSLINNIIKDLDGILEDLEGSSSKISGILNRNYYTIAHDLNPGENKEYTGTENGDHDHTLDEGDDDELEEAKTNDDQEEEDEDDIDEAEHLEKGGGKLGVTVENPEKTQTPMESYITYEVNTVTDRVEYSAQQMCIRRRYQDFLWLKERLETVHPGTLIPPLPAKQAVKGVLDRFSVEFVRRRCTALRNFLHRLSLHPKLNRSKNLRKFLTMSSTDFTMLRKSSSGGFGSKMNFVKMIAPAMTKPEWAAQNDTQEKLQHKMDSLEKNTEHLCTLMTQMRDDFDILLPTIINWEKTESKEELAQSLRKLRCAAMNSTKCCEKLETDVSEKVIPVFREYSLFSDSVKGLLRRRDASQTELEGFQETIKSKQADETATRLGKFTISGLIGGNTEQYRQDRLAKLEIEIREFQAAEVIAKRNLTKLEEQATKEIMAYNRCRVLDLAETFRNLAANHATFHEETANAWRNATSIDMGE